MTLLLLIAPALAQDCDARALEKTLKAASPTATATAFSALAACDPVRARKQAATSFPKVLSGEDANAAVISAIEIGAGDVARTWIGDLQSDERSSAIAALGQACNGSEAVADWLVAAPGAMGDTFWSERWYRSLTQCHTNSVQAMLTREVENPSDDRSRFMGVLEVYAQNLGIDAIPRLGALAIELENTQEIGLVINAFGDAAGVGSLAGANPEAVALAVKTLVSIAPQLPPKLVDQIRSVLVALGALDASDALAGVRFDGARQADGNLHYGLVYVTEQACKKGTVLKIHTGEVVQSGTLWPDQLEAPVREAVAASWELAPAKKCTVQGADQVFLTLLPLPDAASAETFHADTVATLDSRGTMRQDTVTHEPLSLP